jgi:hypothetical protein
MKLQRRVVITAVLSAGLATFTTTSGAHAPDPLGAAMNYGNTEPSGVHDFDFFVGRWRVHHRRLKERLANSHEWLQFEGTAVTQALLGGYGNIDDNVLALPGDPYRAVTLRAFDAKTGQWSIWWLDSRSPQGPLDPPVRGSFKDGVGTFFADNTFNNKPIQVRFIWSRITRTSCHWEQAFSPDGGMSWETNWEMEFEREH